MTKRLAQRRDRRKRSYQADQDESPIPINRETAEIIAQQKKLFQNSSAANRVRMIHCFSTQASSFTNFLAMSPLMKCGKVCCRLRVILE